MEHIIYRILISSETIKLNIRVRTYRVMYSCSIPCVQCQNTSVRKKSEFLDKSSKNIFFEKPINNIFRKIKTGKISIFFEDLSRNSVFRTEVKPY